MPDARVSRHIGAVDVVATCAAGQEPLARDVLATVAGLAARSPLRPGLRVRFGWSLLTLQDTAAGELTICEPDFDGDPLHDTRPRIATTLDVLRRQVALLRQIEVAPADIGFDQFVVAQRGALARNPVDLFRNPPEGDDSGWRVVTADDPGAGSDAETIPVYRLLALCPAAMAVLTLPPEFAVRVDRGQVAAVFDAEGRRRL